MMAKLSQVKRETKLAIVTPSQSTIEDSTSPQKDSPTLPNNVAKTQENRHKESLTDTDRHTQITEKIKT